jgi:hypothetical protein
MYIFYSFKKKNMPYAYPLQVRSLEGGAKVLESSVLPKKETRGRRRRRSR